MITDIAEILCIPLLIAGFALLGYALQKRTGRERRRWLTVGAVLCLIGGVIPMVFLSATIRMVANLQIVFVVIGGFMAVLALVARAPMIKQKGAATGWCYSVAMLVGGVAMLLTGVWQFVGDFWLPREYIVGNITRADMTSGGGSRYYYCCSYKLRLNGRDYPTTADVFDNAPSWSNVRAEVGAGSGTIFRVTPVVPQERPSPPASAVWPSP